MNKICIQCNILKDIENFSKNWKYIKSTCKDCINKYSKDNYKSKILFYRKSHNAYYSKNKESILKKNKEYHIENPHISKLKKAKRRLRIENWNDGTITSEFLTWLLNSQNNKCVYCNWELIDKQLDHIIPLSKMGLHSFTNVQWLCKTCNLSKWAKTHEEFLKYIKWIKTK